MTNHIALKPLYNDRLALSLAQLKTNAAIDAIIQGVLHWADWDSGAGDAGIATNYAGGFADAAPEATEVFG